MTADLLQRLNDFFSRGFSDIAWDLTDIALVALVFYYLLLLIKGTRAMQMGIGLVFVFVVYQLAKRVGLQTLFTMLDTMLTSIMLIIVVIFQHDIRRALMRFGQRPWCRPGGDGRAGSRRGGEGCGSSYRQTDRRADSV